MLLDSACLYYIIIFKQELTFLSSTGVAKQI